MAGARTTSLLKIRSDAAKPFTAISLSHMLVEIFLLMHPALVPVFMMEFHLSVFEAGLLVTVPSLCRLFIIIPIGILADKHGSKRYIILSMAVSGLSAILVSQSASTFFLMISLSMIMISVSLYHPPGMSAISRLFPNQAERSKAVGLHGATGCIGQSVGTITLGLLLTQFGWRFCYLLFAIPALAWMFALTSMRLPQLRRVDMEKKEENIRQHRDSKTPPGTNRLVTSRYLLLLLSMGTFALATGGVMAFMTMYITSAENVSVEIASIVFGAGPLVGIIGSILGGYMGSRIGDRNSLVVLYLAQVIFLLGLIASPSITYAAVSFLMYQLFSVAVWTPSTSMVVSLMGESSGGITYSLFYLSYDILGAVSPLFAALLIQHFGIIYPFVFAIALLMSSAFLVWLIRLERHKA